MGPQNTIGMKSTDEPYEMEIQVPPMVYLNTNAMWYSAVGVTSAIALVAQSLY